MRYHEDIRRIPSIERGYGPRLLAAFIPLALLACSEDPSGSPAEPQQPATGSIVVAATVTGEDAHRDTDGFQVRVDGGSPRTITDGSALVFPDLSADLHSVTIEHVASNCIVRDENPRTVTVVARQAAAVVFHVDCQPPPTTGGIQVSVATPGFTTFGAALGTGPVVSAVDGAVIFMEVAPGTYSVRLSIDAEACTIGEPNPRTAAVTAGQITRVTFSVTCPPPTGSILVAVTTTGANLPGGYNVRVGEVTDYYCYYYTCQFAFVLRNGSVRFDGLSLIAYYIQLGVPRNCSVSPAIRNVQVEANRVVPVAFAVSCI
jgi:hypothetical protein